ncbi:unnamed protein product [Darwinula stevensoni]|uniref:Uncharacterized protein n=1 Tax=Darwinula stevensoni TaxID=69355 RepID=A0A7R9AFU7_9CRUS|nr:unnamed protein product [Darwinula stevensoni]CAG0903206.1 unnamed protein product [Darwinula stevensoni]
MASGKPISDVMLQYQRDLEFIKHDEVLRDLRIGGFIENQEYWQNVKKDVIGKVSFLVENLPSKGDAAFQGFLASLQKHGHNNLASNLRACEEVKTRLIEKWDELLEFLDYAQISGKLVAKGILPAEWEVGLTSAQKRREAILLAVRGRGPYGYQAFLDALSEIGQSFLMEN